MFFLLAGALRTTFCQLLKQINYWKFIVTKSWFVVMKHCCALIFFLLFIISGQISVALIYALPPLGIQLKICINGHYVYLVAGCPGLAFGFSANETTRRTNLRLGSCDPQKKNLKRDDLLPVFFSRFPQCIRATSDDSARIH